MSCGFGEINIPSSRAFWDDECEDEFCEVLEHNEEPLKLTFEPNQPTEVVASDRFVLVEGLYIAKFVEHTLLKNSTKICNIPAKNSALYLRDDGVLIALLEEDLTSSGEVTTLLVPYAKKAANVITVNVKPAVDFKTDDVAVIRDEITFIRGLNSTLSHIKPLKTPNFIVGVAAGVASWRYNQKLPVSSYVAYTDKISMDTLAAQPLLTLLQDLELKPDTSYSPKYEATSNLYS